MSGANLKMDAGRASPACTRAVRSARRPGRSRASGSVNRQVATGLDRPRGGHVRLPHGDTRNSQALHRRRGGRCPFRAELSHHQSGDRQEPVRSPGRQRDRCRPGSRCRDRRLCGLVGNVRGGARPGPEPCRGAVAGAARGVGAAGGAGHRQADRRGDGGGCGFRRRRHRVLCRAGGQPARKPCRPAERLRLYAARALGSLRRHRRLELPAADRLLEIRPGAGLRQHHGVQALGADAADSDGAGGDLYRGGASGRRLQRGARLRADRPRARHPCGSRQGVADRLGAHRPQGDGGRGGIAQTRDHGAGRQVAADPVRRCRSGQRRLGDPAGQFLYPGRSLFERHAGVRGEHDQGRVPGAAAGAGGRR